MLIQSNVEKYLHSKLRYKKDTFKCYNRRLKEFLENKAETANFD